MKKLLILCLLTSACGTAGVSLKQTVTLSLQTSETLLEGAQTIERQLCFNTPATESGPTCTNTLGIAAGLNLMKPNPNKASELITVHQLIAFYFNEAGKYEQLAATALPAWKAGDPAPSSVATYQADILAVLSEAQQLLPTPGVKAFVDKAQATVDAGAVIATAVGVK